MKKRLYCALVVLLSLLSFETKAHERTTDAIKIVKTYEAKVSWYKHGLKTANGERFNPNLYTVAHRTLPFGTWVRFTDPETNKKVIARVNDRGPFIGGRQFDLSWGSAKKLGILDKGVTRLKVEIIKYKT